MRSPFRHLGLKLLSLGLALLLWMAVAGEEIVERGLRVPLELQQFPSGLELQAEPPAAADVRVRGASAALSRLSPGDVVAVLDLHGAQTGRRLFHLTPEQVRAPFGVDVVQVSPAMVALSFEASATKRVDVTASVEGKPAGGYVIGKPSIDPPTVDVIGPESEVKRVTEALTEPVSVAGARDRVREVVSIGLVDPLLRLKGPRTATVTVPILPAPVERIVRSVPVHLRDVAAGLSADAVPPSVSLNIRGTREQIERVDVEHFNAFVDLARLGPGVYTLPVHADGSPDVGVTKIDPSAVQVRIASAK